jgi:uncharacterized membrane protein
MTLATILIIAVLLSLIFHFIGVYAQAKKIVWFVIFLLWAASISITTSEVKPKAYEDVKKMQGKYADTDKIIEDSKPEISIYELILIKNSFLANEPHE